MRKAFVVREASIPSLMLPNQWGEWAPQAGRRTAIRVKLTAYRPARPVTLARFRGIPALALVREFERDQAALQL